jgi:hypothetical protein
MDYIRHGYIRLIILDKAKKQRKEGKKTPKWKKSNLTPKNCSSRTSLSGGWVSSNYCSME